MSEQAGQIVERSQPGLPFKKQFYAPKEITITACTGCFYKAVDDKGELLTVDNDDRKLFIEKH